MNGIPADRIRLRMEGGLPQDMSEAVAFALVAALKFCAQPQVFPAFRAFAVADNSGTWAAEILGKMPRAALFETEALIAAGVLADMEDAS